MSTAMYVVIKVDLQTGTWTIKDTRGAVEEYSDEQVWTNERFRTMLRLMFHEITTPEANTMGFGDTFDVPGQSGLDTPSITENSDTARNTGRIHRSRGKMDIMNLIDLTAESSPSKQKGKQKEEPQQPGPRDHFAQDSSAIGTLAKEQDQDQGGFAFNNVGVGKMAAAIEMAELLELELDLVLGVIDSDWQV